VSGIAGILGVAADRARPAVDAMMRAMIHRGPDAEGYVELPLGTEADSSRGVLGLGHRRLASIDTSQTGGQPMHNAATGDVLAFDGFISGHRAMRYKLESMGCVFRGTSDAEVLLHTLAVFGEEALLEVDGMFSLAFFQAGTRRLLLARDPLGTKPLYTACTPHGLVFASEVRAVLASGLVDDAIDPAGLATFLAYGAPQDPLTIHREIRSFPAGSLQWLSNDSATWRPDACRRYWSFPVITDVAADENVLHDVEFELSRSVRDHGESDKSACVFLSGGLDSAVVAAFARTLTGPVQTFFFGYEGPLARPGAAESAAAVAHAIGTRHFQTILDDEWAIQQFAQWLKASDRPSTGGFNTYVISGAASDAEIAVALSGLGGDELFGGYRCFRNIPRSLQSADRIERLPGPLQVLARSVGTAASVSARATPYELVAFGQRIASNSLLESFGLRYEALELSPHFLPETEAPTPAPADGVFQQVCAALCTVYLGNSLLRDTDCYGMANCVQIRTPFLARKVIDVVAAIPERIKNPARTPPKHLLRLTAAERIPDAISRQRIVKQELPFRQWLYGPLQDVAQAGLAALKASGLVPAEAVAAAWAASATARSRHRPEVPLALVALGHYLLNRKQGGSQTTL
jgi:asparagine synthase (glutamine-hydrolysing)